MNYTEEQNHNSGLNYQQNAQYQNLRSQYLKSGITYKSNEILHKLSQKKGYAYPLLVDIAKLFHMNQFQIIFFCHILNDEQCSYQSDPGIFDSSMPIPDLVKIYNKMTNNGQIQIKIRRPYVKVEADLEQEQDIIPDDEEDNNIQYWNLKQLKKLYIYLLVIGYSIKYYLNESTKAYEQQVKRKYPQFFTTIFNAWVDKYSNKVLRTNPKKINQFYIQLFMAEETAAFDNTELDCQYRNYNEIVEQLIKATSDADEGMAQEDRDYADNN